MATLVQAMTRESTACAKDFEHIKPSKLNKLAVIWYQVSFPTLLIDDLHFF